MYRLLQHKRMKAKLKDISSVEYRIQFLEVRALVYDLIILFGT